MPDDNQPLKSIASLRSVVAGATGISSGSAHTIGQLLLPEIGGRSIMDLHEPQFDNDTSIDGVACHCITGQRPKGRAQEIWIEKETLLLRKVISWDQTSRSVQVRENIRVNEEMASTFFACPTLDGSSPPPPVRDCL